MWFLEPPGVPWIIATTVPWWKLSREHTLCSLLFRPCANRDKNHRNRWLMRLLLLVSSVLHPVNMEGKRNLGFLFRLWAKVFKSSFKARELPTCFGMLAKRWQGSTWEASMRMERYVLILFPTHPNWGSLFISIVIGPWIYVVPTWPLLRLPRFAIPSIKAHSSFGHHLQL